MRTTLVPAVIEAAKRNIAQQNKDLWLFEQPMYMNQKHCL